MTGDQVGLGDGKTTAAGLLADRDSFPAPVRTGSGSGSVLSARAPGTPSFTLCVYLMKPKAVEITTTEVFVQLLQAEEK